MPCAILVDADASACVRSACRCVADAGDKSEAESSGDEHELRASMRSILPKLANVAMPTPRPSAFSVDELIARGGTPIEEMPTDDWL